MLPAAAELGVEKVVHFSRVSSTMDEAHRLAGDGAVAGTCVIADEQTAGRGRGGRHWVSEEHGGVWLTLLERPVHADGLDVLSLRIGLVVAGVLEQLDRSASFALKWPNDVFRDSRKVAGVLVEARWREQALEWVAIGIGINLRVPDALSDVGSLAPRVDRSAVLRALVPGLRMAAAKRGILDAGELTEWHARDLTLGRRVVSPLDGIARGITETGALRVANGVDGTIQEVRSGSLVMAE